MDEEKVDVTTITDSPMETNPLPETNATTGTTDSYMETEPLPETLKITTNDGESFTINRDIIDHCVVIQEAGIYQKEDDIGVPLPNIDSVTMRNIIKFFELYKNQCLEEASKPKPETEPQSSTDAPAKESEVVSKKKPLATEPAALFCYNLPNDEFEKLCKSGSYLQSDVLVDYTVFSLAMHMEGKDIHELRKMFQLRDDYTDEQEEEFLRRHIDAEPAP